jgi:hypothetical protein
VHFLSDVLDAYQNSGVHIVATVCDMGASNVKTLKLLGATKGNHPSGFMIKKLQQYMILSISSSAIRISLLSMIFS